MGSLRRWLRPRTVVAFLALQFAGNAALQAISWGAGLVFSLFLTRTADLPWYLAPILFLGLLLIGAGTSALLLRNLIPASWLERSQALPSAQDGEQAEKPAWESVVDATSAESLTFLLRALSAPHVARGLACDVKAPSADFPVRATLRTRGVLAEAHVHYPENFPDADPVVAGTYRVTWYAVDENGEWRALVSATHDVTPGTSMPRAPESATD